MNLRPLGDRVLIRPDVNPDQTASGLWLSEHKKPEESGTVVAVGLEVRFPSVRVGDYVLFSWAVGQEILLDDERYLLMRESDLLAVCEGIPA